MCFSGLRRIGAETSGICPDMQENCGRIFAHRQAIARVAPGTRSSVARMGAWRHGRFEVRGRACRICHPGWIFRSVML